MTFKPFVLVVSTVADVATDEVVRHLLATGTAHRRLNTEDFPFSRSVTLTYQDAGHPTFAVDGQSLPQPSSVWYRRLRSPPKPVEMEESVYDFCLRENRATLIGGLLSMNCSWMSHPAAIWQAENKPYQLACARALGFRIPHTLVSNEEAAVRQTAETVGRMIVKPTRSGHVVHQGLERAIFTTELTARDLKNLEGVELSPAIYQELIPKRFDIRVTIVGRQLFAAAIDSQSDPAAAIDWRHTENPALPHQPITLPEAVEHRLLALMDRLQLTFGAVDLVQTLDDEFVFLEVNPNGQWLWLDDILDLGISKAVAVWLANAGQV